MVAIDFPGQKTWGSEAGSARQDWGEFGHAGVSLRPRDCSSYRVTQHLDSSISAQPL